MHSLVALTLAYGASAKMIDIAIGEGGLKYSPDSVTAEMGDVLKFNWPSSIPHNVLSSDYNKPCQANGLIASPVESMAKMDFYVMVNSTDPMFFYCSVGDHCNDGMVLAVNPSSTETLATYMSGAEEATIGQPMSMGAAGGILAPPDTNPFSGAAASSMSMSMSMSMSASGMSTSMPATMTGMSTMSMGDATMTATGATPAMTSEASMAGGNGAGALVIGGPVAIVGAAVAGVAMML